MPASVYNFKERTNLQDCVICDLRLFELIQGIIINITKPEASEGHDGMNTLPCTGLRHQVTDFQFHGKLLVVFMFCEIYEK